MKKPLIVLPALLLVLPLAASAQMEPLSTLIGAIASVVGALVPILVTLGLAVFLWGLVRYLWGSGGKADIEGAKKLIKWGLLILFVMVSVWGILNLMQAALGVNKDAEARGPGILYPGVGGYRSVNNANTGADPSFNGYGQAPY